MRHLFVLGLAVLSLVGCKKSPPQNQEAPLVVILSPDNPPFEFKDTAHGGEDVIGFDVEVVKELSQRLGRPLKIIEADFGAIIPSLQAGRADLAVSEIFLSEERRKSVDFSDPYYVNKSVFLVPESSSLASETDLAGQSIGVQLGTTNEALARKWAEHVPNLNLVARGKVGELVQELKNGRVSAILIGGKVAEKVAANTPGFKVVAANTSGGEIAIAFPKGSPLVQSVNEALKTMKNALKILESKWFSCDPS